MKKKKGIEPLDLEVAALNVVNWVEKVDKKLKKGVKTDLLKALMAVGPFAILMILYFMLQSNLLLLMGCIYIGISVATHLILETIRSEKKIKNRVNDNNINTSDVTLKLGKQQEPTLDMLLKDGISTKNAADYYTANFQEYLDAAPNIEEEQEFLSLKKRSELRLVDQEDLLTKEEAIGYLVDNVNEYYRVYNLPKWSITPNQWDKFFDIMYYFFQTKGIEQTFYKKMFFLLKLFFANALVEGARSLTIQSLLNSLKYLSSSDFTEKEIYLLQKEIISNLEKVSVIELKRKGDNTKISRG